jgi:hypothetical protein
MSNSILKIVAIITLVIQVIIPTWWATVFASFYFFWVEGVIEGGGVHIGAGYEGNLLWGVVSIYSIFAIIVPIYFLISIRKANSEQVPMGRDIVFFIFNLMTIVGVMIAITLNGGILPRL